MALKLQSIGTQSAPDSGGSDKTLIVVPGQGGGETSRPSAVLPVIGGKPQQEQIKILAVAFAVLALLAVVMMLLTGAQQQP